MLSIILKALYGLHCGTLFWLKSGCDTQTSIMQCNWRKYRLLNKQNHYCSSILVIISVLCIHYEVLLFRVYLTFEFSKYSKVRIPGLDLTMCLILGYLKNIFNLLGKVVRPKPNHLEQFRCPWIKSCYSLNLADKIMIYQCWKSLLLTTFGPSKQFTAPNFYPKLVQNFMVSHSNE